MPGPETNNTHTTVDNPDIKALLDTANSASERVAGLHVAFMAVCAYVLVIVIGTTDLDLLMGKGVRLPVVNVDVPIVGFYAFAPYLVVLAHFNLLLQLQLLSRKLFAFDSAAPQEEGIGGLRDRLHIFPYTYYLVGRPSPLVKPLIGLMVSITLVLLPFVTLIALQLRFLAYQDEVVTWFQRLAVWLDVAAIFILWPIILHPKDDWKDYWRRIIVAHVPRKRIWVAFALILVGHVLFSFGAVSSFFLITQGEMATVLVAAALLLLSPIALIALWGWKALSRTRVITTVSFFLLAFGILFLRGESSELVLMIIWLILPAAVFWHPQSPRGSFALLLALYMGTMLPLTLQIHQEALERIILRAQRVPIGSTFTSMILYKRRQLDLNEQVLLSKPPRPETLAQIRSDDWRDAIKQIEPINLRRRYLQGASMSKAILIAADLRAANLQGAYLNSAALQGADLSAAQLQAADLMKAQLQGANLRNAMLRGAILVDAQLLGADLSSASLQGALLKRARLPGADLAYAKLQGASLRETDLRGVNLQGAYLTGADMRGANLYAAQIDKYTKMDLVDARGMLWEPLENETYGPLLRDAQTVIEDTDRRTQVRERLTKAYGMHPVKLRAESCLAPANVPLQCSKWFDPGDPEAFREFAALLHTFLGQLACESAENARSIIRQVPRQKGTGSSREGLEVELKKRVDDKECAGLQGLSIAEKEELRTMKIADKVR